MLENIAPVGTLIERENDMEKFSYRFHQFKYDLVKYTNLKELSYVNEPLTKFCYLYIFFVKIIQFVNFQSFKRLESRSDWYYELGAVMQFVVLVIDFVGIFYHCDAEDASMLCGGLHHFALVQKKSVIASC